MFNELYNEFGHLRGKDALTIEDCNYIMSLCNGCLDLRPLSEGDRYTPKLPNNLVVCKHLNIMDCDIDSLPKGLVIHGSLIANRSNIKTLPDDIVIDGDILLDGSGIIELPDNLTVNGDLNLRDTKIITLPNNLVVKGILSIALCTNIIELPDGLVVGGDLNATMSGLRELPKDLRVGGSILIQHTNISSIPDRLIVNGDLCVRGSCISNIPNGVRVRGGVSIGSATIDTITVGNDVIICGKIIVHGCITSTVVVKFNDNVTIGGGIIRWAGTKITLSIYPDERLANGVGVISNKKYHKLQNGDYVEGKYIYVDSRLTLIKGTHKVGKYTIYKGFFKGYNVITDGEYYAHCDKIKDGIADIEYKRAEDRGIDAYESLTLNSVVTKDDAITMYRVITGACHQGTQMFIDSLGDNIKDEYTIAEIIELTSGQYGSGTFREFFTKEE
jgi:hypothetical protein